MLRDIVTECITAGTLNVEFCQILDNLGKWTTRMGVTTGLALCRCIEKVWGLVRQRLESEQETLKRGSVRAV